MKLKLKQVLTDVLTLLKSHDTKLSSFVIETRTSASINVPANGNATGTINISKAGYIPLGIVSATTYHGSLLIQDFWIDSASSARVITRNITGGAISRQMAIRVLYIKA